MNAIKERIEEFLDRWPNAEWGSAHCVLSDHNLEDVHINGAFAELSRCPATEEVVATMGFLLELLAVPEDHRCEDDS